MSYLGYGIISVLLVASLSGCAPVISSDIRKEARKDLTFEQVQHNPSAFSGSIVIWGGIIISTATRTGMTEITVLETPLSSREKPENSEYTGGRFIAVTPQFLDPVVYAKGRKITVAGQLTGAAIRPLGKSMRSYSYPVISIKQIHLWSIPEYSPPDYWWYGEPYGFWGDEGFGPEERFGEPAERGHEEENESPAEERSEGGRK